MKMDLFNLYKYISYKITFKRNMPGFRPFANEINSKGPTGSIMPTFDNFKKDYKPPSKPRK